VIDLGTGDGRAVLARSRRDPEALVIGLDAAAAAMAQSSSRAARPAPKGGLPNALFVVAAAEAPPAELLDRADEVTIHFPWGSLLRGALALDDALTAANGIARLLAPAGRVLILASVETRDQLSIEPLTGADRDTIASRWALRGLSLTAFEPADPTAIEASGSSWARRLRTGQDRRVWRLELRRSIEPVGALADRR
jgi:16S rRNA (adenine(1408)-N(1))-methyltransferase